MRKEYRFQKFRTFRQLKKNGTLKAKTNDGDCSSLANTDGKIVLKTV